MKALADSIVPPPPTSPIQNATEPVPEIGNSSLSANEVAETVQRLEANPPQKFDLARKVMIFNAYVEFVEIELLGTQIGRHRVEIPRELVLAASDDETRQRLKASFELLQVDSGLKREAELLRKKVDLVRREMVKSVGKRYGTIVLRVHREALEKKIAVLKAEVDAFKLRVKAQIAGELQTSRAQLVKSLVPVIEGNPPDELRYSVTGSLNSELVSRYLDRKLVEVFPTPDQIVGEMELNCTFKGVTYETLNEAAFQAAVRNAFPEVDFEKPFEESVGVKVAPDGAPGGGGMGASG